jgi:branched-chain amino acid transport system substrate-binding protein
MAVPDEGVGMRQFYGLVGRRLLAAALVLGLVVGVAACGGDDDADDPTAGGGGDSGDSGEGGEAPEGDPIRIGISLPLTGEFSEPGVGVRQGYETWADLVNESGGLLGRPVELLFRDDASDPNRVVSDYESLITQEEVDLVFGPFSTRLVIPAAEVAESYDMLFVEPAGAAPEVFEQGFEYLFYAAPAVASDHYDYLAEWILDLPEDERPQTAAYATLDDPFAQGTAYGLKDALEEGGIETVADEVYPPSTTSFTSIAATIADADADIVVGGTQYEDGVGLVRAFQELGYQPDLAAFSTAPTLPEFGEAVASATEGVIAPVGWSMEADFGQNQAFVEHHREVHGEDPDEDAANGFTTGEVVAAAVEEVGCAEQGEECQGALADHIRETEFDTIVGPLAFDEAGRPQAAHMILQWQDGEIEIVLPADSDVQTADIQFPKAEW